MEFRQSNQHVSYISTEAPRSLMHFGSHHIYILKNSYTHVLRNFTDCLNDLMVVFLVCFYYLIVHGRFLVCFYHLTFLMCFYDLKLLMCFYDLRLLMCFYDLRLLVCFYNLTDRGRFPVCQFSFSFNDLWFLPFGFLVQFSTSFSKVIC